MDVTQQINRQMIGTGAGSSQPEYFAVNRSLNFAKSSNSIINAAPDRVTVAPAVRNYKDTVGLFGAENIFIKVDLDILNSSYVDDDGIVQDDYVELTRRDNIDDSTFEWQAAFADYSKDLLPIENSYEPAEFTNDLTFVPGAVALVSLRNLKTGNKYIDCWFDTRLYRKDREEHPYDSMYVPLDSYFYVGFHARNTKRLPYNVSLTVGNVIKSKYDLLPAERRLLVD